jgi:putative phosphoesterase
VKVLVFSDLHGNFDALEALQGVEGKPDVVFFLGDVVGYGPEPKLCLSWIKANVTDAVRGDHDEAVATNVRSRCPPELQSLSEDSRAHTRRMMSQSDLEYLGSLALEQTVDLGGTRFYLTHAAPSDHLGKALPLTTAKETELAQEIAELDVDVVFLGHTHVPAIRRVGSTVLVNPGSLGQPWHGTPSPTYAAWEDGELQIRHIHYNLIPVLRKLSLLPLDPEHVARLQAIIQKGLG